MPHIPRFAPSGLHHPLGLPQNEEHAKASHLAEKAKEKAKEKTTSKGSNPFVTKLNMKKWDYDPELVIQQMDKRK
jgi:hypothetical protein